MSVLDQAERWPNVDPRSMRSLVESFPSQVSSAAEMFKDLSLTGGASARNLVLTGLGGSAIGGDVVRCAAGDDLKIPFLINRDYQLPGFVDHSTLVLACSYSGNTEETLGAYRQACAAKAAVVCISSGGQLASWARSEGCPLVSIPPGLPPRAALGYSAVAILRSLHALGLLPDPSAALQETVQILRPLADQYGTGVPEKSNVAKQIAASLHGKVVAVYGSNRILDAAAARWRGQIEENAKNLALHHVLPEMNHNELVGWKYPAEVLSRIGVVLLRDKGDHPQVHRRFELTKEIVQEHAAAIHEVWSQGESLLARIMSVIYLGDFVSLYMAYLNSADPMPVDVIDYLKQKLSK